MPDLSNTEQCASCPVSTGECPRCGTFWWTDGWNKRYGCRPATEQDAQIIRDLQGRWGDSGTGGGIVFPDELPNRIGPIQFTRS